MLVVAFQCLLCFYDFLMLNRSMLTPTYTQLTFKINYMTHAAMSSWFGSNMPVNSNKYACLKRSLIFFASALPESHRFCDRVQDAYTLRCCPQVSYTIFNYLYSF